MCSIMALSYVEAEVGFKKGKVGKYKHSIEVHYEVEDANIDGLLQNATNYWVRDWPVYGRNPVNVKSGKKTQEISEPEVLFSRTSKQKQRRFCPTLYCSEHNNSKAMWPSFYV